MYYHMKKITFVYLFSMILVFSALAGPRLTLASTPYLAFTDLISGPDTGIDDGKGSGVIVTVWGQNLGAEKGVSEIFFTDAAGVRRKAAFVYYWKNSDGERPSGPAKLYESHNMQEIAFSVPKSSAGEGAISVLVGGIQSNSIPFTVRSGKIFHVKSSGKKWGAGSWKDPIGSISAALSVSPSGSTIYIHDVDAGSFENPEARAIYWNNASASSSLSAQFSLVAYPGFQPKAIGQRAVEPYLTEGLVVSKLDIYASNYLSVDVNDQPIGKPITTIGGTGAFNTTKNGRSVANRIGDIPGGCVSGQAGAIVGSAQHADYVSNFKALGNEIYDYGCAGTSKFHHTTYMTVRSKPHNRQVTPWEWGYNYLHGNHAKFGIHNYDEGANCGDLSGPLRIYKNVIVDQGGAGISVGSTCGWSMDVIIENNVLIDVGRAAAWDGLDPSTSDGAENGGISIRDGDLTGTVYVYNNLIYEYTADRPDDGSGCLTFQSDGDNVKVVWGNNICFSRKDVSFIGFGYRAQNKLDNVSGSNSVWSYAAKSTASKATVPNWDSEAVVGDPGIDVKGSLIYLSDDSLVIDPKTKVGGGYSRLIWEGFDTDIYGNYRDADPDIGPVEFRASSLEVPPAPPAEFNVQ